MGRILSGFGNQNRVDGAPRFEYGSERRVGELQLQGQSSASASLIATIESSPRFENARFRSPVVQIAGSDKDRFHISADIVEVQAQ